jgi:hypothetical protein
MNRANGPLARAGAGTAALALVLAACSGGGSKPPHSSPPVPATGAPSAGAGPTNGSGGGKTVATGINPLTGLRATNNPVIAVKIDDTAAGRPQVGVDQADIVYVKQVEGGLTRLLAVFNTHLPVVEPVRSTRADDPELVMEYGPIDYVASGGDHAELAPLRRSNLRRDLDNNSGRGFARDSRRVAPFNLTANLAQIAREMKGPGPKDIGLVWSRTLPHGTSPGTKVRTKVGNTPVEFNWSPKLHRYVRLIGGVVQHTANGHVISTPNVIVQFCRSTVYRKDIDTAGNPAQWTHTLGSGHVVVFRDGRRIDGTWSREAVKDGTTLRDTHGQPIALAPGGAWFVQTAMGTPLQ